MITVQAPDGQEVDVETDDPVAAANAVRKHFNLAPLDSGEGTPDPGPAQPGIGKLKQFLGHFAENPITRLVNPFEESRDKTPMPAPQGFGEKLSAGLGGLLPSLVPGGIGAKIGTGLLGSQLAAPVGSSLIRQGVARLPGLTGAGAGMSGGHEAALQMLGDKPASPGDIFVESARGIAEMAPLALIPGATAVQKLVRPALEAGALATTSPLVREGRLPTIEEIKEQGPVNAALFYILHGLGFLAPKAPKPPTVTPPASAPIPSPTTAAPPRALDRRNQKMEEQQGQRQEENLVEKVPVRLTLEERAEKYIRDYPELHADWLADQGTWSDPALQKVITEKLIAKLPENEAKPEPAAASTPMPDPKPAEPIEQTKVVPDAVELPPNFYVGTTSVGPLRFIVRERGHDYSNWGEGNTREEAIKSAMESGSIPGTPEFIRGEEARKAAPRPPGFEARQPLATPAAKPTAKPTPVSPVVPAAGVGMGEAPKRAEPVVEPAPSLPEPGMLPPESPGPTQPRAPMPEQPRLPEHEPETSKMAPPPSRVQQGQKRLTTPIEPTTRAEEAPVGKEREEPVLLPSETDLKAKSEEAHGFMASVYRLAERIQTEAKLGGASKEEVQAATNDIEEFAGRLKDRLDSGKLSPEDAVHALATRAVKHVPSEERARLVKELKQTFEKGTEVRPTKVPSSAATAAAPRGAEGGKAAHSTVSTPEGNAALREKQRRQEPLTEAEEERLIEMDENEGVTLDVSLAGPRVVRELKMGSNADVKVAGPQLFGWIKNHPGEIHPSEYNEAALKEFLSEPRSRNEVAAWLEENGPKIEVKKLGESANTPEQVEFGKLQHEFVDATPGAKTSIQDRERGQSWEEIIGEYAGPGVDQDAAIVKRIKSKEFQDKVDRYIELSKAESLLDEGRSEGYTTRGIATPKAAPQMPGAVDILVRVPLRGPFAKDLGEAYSGVSNEVGNKRREESGLKYSSFHYPTEGKNLVVHVRGYMETLPDGRKVFHVFEIQSDWAQEFGQDTNNKKVANWLDSKDHRRMYSRFATEAEAKAKWKEELQRYIKDNPDAPIAHAERLGVKAAIEHAREQGATHIAISDAETAMLTEGHDRAMQVIYKPGEYQVKDLNYGYDNLAYLTDTVRVLPENNYEILTSSGRWVKGESLGYQDNQGLWDRITSVVPSEKKISQAEGMRLHYDRTLPKIAEEVTGERGEMVEFGEHQNAMLERPDADTHRFGANVGTGPRPDLIFKSPDGSPKTSISARLYPVSRAKGEFSMFGSDKAARQERLAARLTDKQELIRDTEPLSVKDRVSQIHEDFRKILRGEAKWENADRLVWNLDSMIGEAFKQGFRAVDDIFGVLREQIGKVIDRFAPNVRKRINDWMVKQGDKAFGEEEQSRETPLADNEGTTLEVKAKDDRPSLIARGLEGVVGTIGRELDPLFKLPESEKYLEARNKMTGGKARIARHVEQLVKQEQLFPMEEQLGVTDFMQGDKQLSEVNPALRATALTTRRLFDAAGRAAVARGYMKPETFERMRGTYFKRVYMRYLMDSLGPGTGPGGGGRAKMDLSWQKQRTLTEEEYRTSEMGGVQGPQIRTKVGLTQQWGDIFKHDFMNSILQNDRWTFQPSLVYFRGTGMGVDHAAKLLDTMRKMLPAVERAQKPFAEDAIRDLEGLVAIAEKGSKQEVKDFIRIPDNKGYGILRGALVHRDIANDIISHFEFRDPSEQTQFIKRLVDSERMVTAVWKTGKTAFNPPTVVRNALSNPWQLYASDMSLIEVSTGMVGAIKDLVTNSARYKQAIRQGAISGTFGEAEIGELVRASRYLTEGKGSLDSMLETIGKIGRTYGKIDEFYKLVKFNDVVSKGGSPVEAAREAHKWVMDYSLVGPITRMLRQHVVGIPFLTYQAKILPLGIETARKRPWKFAPLLAIPAAATAYALSKYNLTEDDWAELQLSMSDRLKDGNLILVPDKDAKGRWQYTSIDSFNPWGSWYEVARNLAKGKPGDAMDSFGQNPIMLVRAALATGIDPSSNRQIWSPLDSPSDRAYATTKFIYDLAVPGWMSSHGAGAKALETAGVKDRGIYDTELTPAQAAAKWFGLEVKGVDWQDYVKQARAFDAKVKDLEVARSREMRDATKASGMSEADVLKIQKDFLREYQKLIEQRTEPSRGLSEKARRAIAPAEKK